MRTIKTANNIGEFDRKLRKKLSEKEYYCFIQKEALGASISEIAKMLNVSRQTISSKIKKIHEKINSTEVLVESYTNLSEVELLLYYYQSEDNDYSNSY